MSVAALARRVTEFGFMLLEKGHAIDARSHAVNQLTRTKAQLGWVRADPDASLIIDSPVRVSDYIDLIDRGDYSFLLNDGGVIQILYTFETDKIERHRLCYFPCPFSVDMNLLDQFEVGLSDLIRNVYMGQWEDSLSLRSPVRFDYAPEEVKDFHPASHFTFNEPGCRIPVKSPVRFDRFMKFVIENFYPDIASDSDVFDALVSEHDDECLTDHDRGRTHFTWLTT